MRRVPAKQIQKRLIGRRIVAVDLYPFADGRGGTATQPVLHLDNGRRVWFTVQETEVGEYGVAFGFSRLRPKKEAK